MNILLFEDSSFVDDSLIAIENQRIIDHVLTVLKLSRGDTIRIGQINGNRGTGCIDKISSNKLIIQTDLKESPPQPLPCTLILAMPRPKVFKRVLQTAVTMGVKKIYIIKTWRVDKNYFDSPALNQEHLLNQALLGLEQAGDTILPELYIRKYFKPFMEDEVPEIINLKKGILAHPYGITKCPAEVKDEIVLAIGPEGGFIQYELDKFEGTGFMPVFLGERILRVEQALPVFLSHLFY